MIFRCVNSKQNMKEFCGCFELEIVTETVCYLFKTASPIFGSQQLIYDHFDHIWLGCPREAVSQRFARMNSILK